MSEKKRFSEAYFESSLLIHLYLTCFFFVVIFLHLRIEQV